MIYVIKSNSQFSKMDEAKSETLNIHSTKNTKHFKQVNESNSRSNLIQSDPNFVLSKQILRFPPPNQSITHT